MADQNVTQLTEATTVAGTDLVYTVVDPAGTPVDRKVTVGNLLTRSVARRRDFYITGRYYTGTDHNDFGSSDDIQKEVPKFSIVPIFENVTVDAMSIWVKTATTATGVARLAIYTVTASGLPDSLVVDAGEVSTETTGAKTVVLGTSQALDPGVYAFGVSCNEDVNIEHEQSNWVYGFGSPTDTAGARGIRTAWVDQFAYAAWPATWTNSIEYWTGISPRIFARIA